MRVLPPRAGSRSLRSMSAWRGRASATTELPPTRCAGSTWPSRSARRSPSSGAAAGAGKSTLAGLIRGDLVPQEGVATLGGVPCSELGDGMARYLGVIQQRTYLFNTTLLENLRIGRPDATEDEVREALVRVGLGDLLDRLPQGLGTLVDEAGMRFSGGERHRIALARVLLQGTPIVLLDEPFAALDPITERGLLDTLLDVFADRTLILITHHLQGVSRMDRVVFISDGAVSLDGAPADLERDSEHYRRLLALDRGTPHTA